MNRRSFFKSTVALAAFPFVALLDNGLVKPNPKLSYPRPKSISAKRGPMFFKNTAPYAIPVEGDMYMTLESLGHETPRPRFYHFYAGAWRESEIL